jgi:hypothetical protein
MTIYNNPAYFQTYVNNASEKRILSDVFLTRLQHLSQCNSLLDIGCHTADLSHQSIFRVQSRQSGVE